jgi:hypothetical protein
MRIIYGTPNHQRSATRSAMNSPFRFVAATTANSIVAAMKPFGGTRLASTLLPPLRRCGERHVRYRAQSVNRTQPPRHNLVAKALNAQLMLRAGSAQSLARIQAALTQVGSPNPQNDRVSITSSCARQLVHSRCQ